MQVPSYFSVEEGPDGEPSLFLINWFLCFHLEPHVKRENPPSTVLVLTPAARLAGHLMSWLPVPLSVLHLATFPSSLSEIDTLNRNSFQDEPPPEYSRTLINTVTNDLLNGIPSYVHTAVEAWRLQKEEKEEERKRQLALKTERDLKRREKEAAGAKGKKPAAAKKKTKPKKEEAEAEEEGDEEEEEEEEEGGDYDEEEEERL